MDPKNLKRRDFLSLMGLSTGLPLLQSPLQVLIEAIVLGAQQKAMAQSLGISPRKYLHILQQGAPPRWTFDLFLTPYSSTGFVPNAQLGTTYVHSSGSTSVAYTTTVKKNINVPALWQFNVPAANGGTRNMDPLLDNLLQLRGIEVGNPDHGAAQELQFVPLGAAQSMSALSADASNAPIPGVNLSLDQYQFKSKAAKAAITVPNSSNMLSTLLSPFVRTNSSSFEVKRKALGPALDASIALLNQAAEAQNAGAASLTTSAKAASDLLSKGFGDLNSIWTNLYNKYNSLATRSLDPTQSLPGINDQVITPDGSTLFQIDGTLITGNDLRGMITTSTRVSRLAEHFAVAEYVLLNNLSDSISIGPGSLSGLTVNNSSQGLGTDEHTTSANVSLILNSYMNLAYAACLLELIDQLKAKNIFNETVIVMGGEFGRSPRKDATGSDHGYLGSSSSIYCGALSGPLVLGNIYNLKGQSDADAGTWGRGAPVNELGRALNQGDWASTIAFLLRVPSPTTAATSLLTSATDGSISSLIEKARQV
ncbi:MAG: DUF1501 domain-containing protein [Pseudobdellovibrionaceae bacterium]